MEPSVKREENSWRGHTSNSSNDDTHVGCYTQKYAHQSRLPLKILYSRNSKQAINAEDSSLREVTEPSGLRKTQPTGSVRMAPRNLSYRLSHQRHTELLAPEEPLGAIDGVKHPCTSSPSRSHPPEGSVSPAAEIDSRT